VNHYDTLQITASASPAEIKRQFYTLSKKNHPDHNRNDPTASTRFVAISEAYHTLSVPEKRAQYDAQLHQSQSRSWGSGGSAYPQGSYSSASFGSRPASGLNKKRSTFRGPPPSFYKTGGYGNHGTKRAEYAYSNANAEGQDDAPRESYGDWGTGYGPGQHRHGHEVPHFDNKRHKETHDQINEHIYARRRRTMRHADVEQEYDRGGMLINFIVVSGVIGMIGMTAKVFGDKNEERSRKNRAG
jgi:curved DNA-binding protein CbpA